MSNEGIDNEFYEKVWFDLICVTLQRADHECVWSIIDIMSRNKLDISMKTAGILDDVHAQLADPGYWLTKLNSGFSSSIASQLSQWLGNAMEWNGIAISQKNRCESRMRHFFPHINPNLMAIKRQN